MQNTVIVSEPDGLKDRPQLHTDVGAASRIHNFGGGPAVLPLEVVTEVAESLPNLNGSGIGVMEISHRSSVFQEVIDSAMDRMRRILSIPEDYEILFLQGGATTQFYMTALNLMSQGGMADFLVTGIWAKKALDEAKRIGDGNAVWDGSDNDFKTVPNDGDYSIREGADYLHYTSNNTLYGTQFHHLPDSGGKPRVVDASSDICGASLDVSEHDLIYAGAQKNLGPSGVTVVILSPWAANRRKEGLPTMMDYHIHLSKRSMFNTPNTYGIFVLDRMLSWVERNGGLEGAIQRNVVKSEMIYDVLDGSEFWRPHAEEGSRSMMNVTWRLAEKSLESTFLAEAIENGIGGLKGHRNTGGIRASLYNGCPVESVEALASFMTGFESRHG